MLAAHEYVYGAVPPLGVRSIAPVFPPKHNIFVGTSDPFTPALISIDGTVPHLGAILDESRGHVLFGEASVQPR